jgi:hypothetical protein
VLVRYVSVEATGGEPLGLKMLHHLYGDSAAVPRDQYEISGLPEVRGRRVGSGSDF